MTLWGNGREFLQGRIRWEEHDLTSLLSYYRYISWLGTSIIYFASPPLASASVKMGVSLLLLLEAYAFVKIYGRAKDKEGAQRLLVIVETLGLVVIFLFTGGLDSPFLWYVINPILLATTLTPPHYFPWAMLVSFLSTAVLFDRYALFTPYETSPLWTERVQLIIVLALTTLIAQLYNYFIDRLSHQARVMERQVKHMTALHGAIEAFSHRHDPQEIAELFAAYGRTLTLARKVIVWLNEEAAIRFPEQGHVSTRGPDDTPPEEVWRPHLEEVFEKAWQGETYTEYIGDSSNPGILLSVKIKSPSRLFGVLSGFFTEVGSRDLAEASKTMILLADLCASALERHRMEAASEEFVLMAEKERIAMEIHDSVTQNLFGLVYGLESLVRDHSMGPEMSERLRLCQRMAHRSMRDLRRSIYDLSSIKSEREPFLNECSRYLGDLARLNDIKVDLTTHGHQVPMSASLQNALYRILREATGNAIRHGQCSRIEVSFSSREDAIILTVSDDGAGFDMPAVERDGEPGLGLVTMRELARTNRGRLEILSSPGAGTTVSFTCPTDGKRISQVGGTQHEGRDH